jgi:hypothetical protein
MDDVERTMVRQRAKWRAGKRGKPFGWCFENWPGEPTEGHHLAREKYGDFVLDVPISMHRELTRRQFEEHPQEGLDPDNPRERLGRMLLGMADIYECAADLHREMGEQLIRAAKGGSIKA